MTEATGGIPVREIVLRVKCELSSAFVSTDRHTWLLNQPKFKWLKTWTAQADLTLQVLDTATLSPGVTYTAPGRVVSGVQESLALAGGATLNGQAQRTETISFAVSLQELESWRSRERTDDVCALSDGLDLSGRLGLREWILEAISPVARENESLPEYLWAGYHPKPGSSPSSGPASPKSSEKTPAAALACKSDQALADSRQYLQEATKVLAAAKASMDATSAAIDDDSKKEKALSQNLASAKKKLAGFISKNANFSAVLDPSIKESEAELSKAIRVSQPILAAAEKNLKDAGAARTAYGTAEKPALSKISQAQAALDSGNADPCAVFDQAIAALQQAQATADSAKLASNNDEAAKENIAKLGELSSFANRVTSSFVNVDPPISSIGQSIQFILAYGGNITPTWTFVHFKGPNGTLFTAQGTRTHILNITLGPALAGTTSAPSQAVTQNQLYLLLNNLLPPVVR